MVINMAFDCNKTTGPWHFTEQTGDCPATPPDWVIINGDLGQVNEVNNAILIQAMTTKTETGWWGDDFLPFPIGSELNLLQGRPLTDELIVDAERMVRESFEPLVSQGLFDTFTVDGSISDGKLKMAITLIRDGETLMTFAV
jgi:phage gp46-like protein